MLCFFCPLITRINTNLFFSLRSKTCLNRGGAKAWKGSFFTIWFCCSLNKIASVVPPSQISAFVLEYGLIDVVFIAKDSYFARRASGSPKQSMENQLSLMAKGSLSSSSATRMADNFIQKINRTVELWIKFFIFGRWRTGSLNHVFKKSLVLWQNHL